MRGDSGYPVRLRFSKRGKVRFVSHRDVARAFERAFRVEALPLAFTKGFAPRPKVSFGLALPVGYESDAEYLDVELVDEADVDALAPAISEALPTGIDVTGAVALRDRAPALQESVTALAYRFSVVADDGSRPDVRSVEDTVEQAMAAASLPVTRIRKGRSVVDDIRPSLRQVAVVGTGEHGIDLSLDVSTQGTPSARPRDLLGVIDAGLVEGRTLRTHQWIERGGARQEPLEADLRPRAVQARAS